MSGPPPNDHRTSDQQGLVIIEDWDNDEFRALIPLDAFADRYLYVSRGRGWRDPVAAG